MTVQEIIQLPAKLFNRQPEPEIAVADPAPEFDPIPLVTLGSIIAVEYGYGVLFGSVTECYTDSWNTQYFTVSGWAVNNRDGSEFVASGQASAATILHVFEL